MKKLYLLYSFFRAMFCLLRPGGARTLAAENLALRQQLIVMNQKRLRAPKLTLFDRLTFGVLTRFISPKRLAKIAIVVKPATLLRFHQALVKRKYHWLFGTKTSKKPGPRGPNQAVIDAIIDMKRHNPRFGYRRIAMQITLAFGIPMDKDTIRRVLAKHGKNLPTSGGPSWLTFLGHMKDSLWSLDFFRCESIHLKTHWVMVVMDQFTRKIIGFSVKKGHLDGVAACALFNSILSTKALPKRLSTDNDPLFTFHRWKANLRVLDINEIKSVPYTPTSHPFIERLIGTIRREYLNHMLFWTEQDLQHKLNNFQTYYNDHRGHSGIEEKTPCQQSENIKNSVIALDDYRWQSHCRGLTQLPKAA